jgi:hypothetical protein
MQIRRATIADSEPIAKALWDLWHQLKARQIPTPLHMYRSPELLVEQMRCGFSQWFICDSSDSRRTGFFCVAPIGSDKTYKRWRFPERAVRVEHFACLLPGEVLLDQFQLLSFELRRESLLLWISSSLRDPYWAALKAGFRPLGESPTMVGTFAWLYLDREQKYDEIQTKLRRAKIVTA